MSGPTIELEGVEVPLRVPAELASRTGEFARAVRRAREIVVEFAAAHGWGGPARDRFVDAVSIESTQEALWRRFVEVLELPAGAALPTDGLAAGLERRVLLAVSPEAYARIRPEYAGEPEAWTRVLAHEMAHRLHVAILEGDEDAMGPLWFFEGFALVAAGQLEAGPGYATVAEALRAARAASGRGSYAVYAAALRSILVRIPLPELVRRAGDLDFEEWLGSVGEGTGDAA